MMRMRDTLWEKDITWDFCDHRAATSDEGISPETVTKLDKALVKRGFILSITISANPNLSLAVSETGGKCKIFNK